MKKIGILLFSLAIITLSCQREEVVPDHPQPAASTDCPELALYSDIPIDPYSIHSVSLSNDCIHIVLELSGGCVDHDLDLTWNGQYLESNPPQVRLQPRHDDNDDPCDAIIYRSIFRDISRIQDPNYNTIIVNVLNPNGTVGAQVTYNY